ncbi:MAG: anti-sigma factor [Acidobacteriaceae bacterium]
MSDIASNPNVPTARGDSRSFGWVGWLGWIIAALAIIAAICFVVHSSSLQRQINSDNAQLTKLKADNARSQQVMDSLTSPDAARVRLSETRRPERPTGHIIYQATSGALIFVASGLRQLPQSKSYELWLMPATGAPISAGLFRPESNGTASVVLLSLPRGIQAKAFSVTIEDVNGSAAPTLPTIMSGRESQR